MQNQNKKNTTGQTSGDQAIPGRNTYVKGGWGRKQIVIMTRQQ